MNQLLQKRFVSTLNLSVLYSTVSVKSPFCTVCASCAIAVPEAAKARAASIVFFIISFVG